MEIIADNINPIRLDRYLYRYYVSYHRANLPHSIIEKALRLGDIKLNHIKAKANIRLKAGDIITLSPYFTNFLTRKIINPIINSGNNERVFFSPKIIHLAKQIQSQYLIESYPEFIAINKPSGIAVQGGSKITLSINDALNYLNITNQENYKLVHRLDKDTSGVLIIARGYENSNKISLAWQQHLIKKIYIAIVENCPDPPSGTIQNYLSKDKIGKSERVSNNNTNNTGKLAITDYALINTNGRYSAIEFRPLTGRTHQLRVHSKLLGCPIIGDQKYGRVKYPRLLLHAKTITMPASLFGQEIIITANYDWDFPGLN